MATFSTTTNGVVLQLPYAVIDNVVTARIFQLSIIGVDPIRGVQNSIRTWPGSVKSIDNGIFIYVGDQVHFDLLGPCNDATAPAFDIVQVNQSTGVGTTQTTARFTAVWQRSMILTVSAINASSGAVTFTQAYR